MIGSSDNIKVKGNLKLVLTSKDGSKKTIEKSNLIVQGGLQLLLDVLSTALSKPILTKVKIGNGDTAPNLSQTSLQGADQYSTTVEFGDVDDYKVRGFFVIPYNAFNGKTIKEFGLFTESNVLFSRVLLGPIDKDETIQISGYWDLSSQPIESYSLTINSNVENAVVTVNGQSKTGSSVVFTGLIPWHLYS